MRGRIPTLLGRLRLCRGKLRSWRTQLSPSFSLRLEVLEDRTAPATLAQLVDGDFNALPANGVPFSFTPVSDGFFFVVDPKAGYVQNDTKMGPQLWKSDGTAAGTHVVKEFAAIATNDLSHAPDVLFPVGSVVYFSADEGYSGFELWRSDGTTAGTYLVADMAPGDQSTFPQCFAASGNIVYFGRSGDNAEREIWQSDGTAAGTVLFVSLGRPDWWEGSYFSGGGVLGNSVYVSVGDELWVADGTATGSKRLDTDQTLMKAHDFHVVNGRMTFFGREATNSGGLFAVDGGDSVPSIVLYFPETANWGRFPVVLNDRLYFRGTSYGTGARNILWKSDGTGPGSEIVEDFSSGAMADFNDFDSLTVAGDLLFGRVRGIDGKYKLWRADGTPAGSFPIIGDSDVNLTGNFLAAAGNQVGFISWNSIEHYSLWKSDGTQAGTVKLKALPAGDDAIPRGVLGFGSTIAFGYRGDGSKLTWSIWASRLTATTTESIATIGSTQTDSGYEPEIVYSQAFADGLPNTKPAFDDGTFPFSLRREQGVELWKSDGAAAGTVLVKDVLAGPASSSPSQFTRAGQYIYFAARNADGGQQIWRSDGTAAGTILVKDATPRSGTNYYNQSMRLLGRWNGELIFAESAYGVTDIYRTDSTAGGTAVVRFFSQIFSALNEGCIVGNLILFALRSSAYHFELWRSDGTTQGTVRLGDFGSRNPELTSFTPFYGIALFIVNYPETYIHQLWKTDGTTAGTVLVASLDVLPDADDHIYTVPTNPMVRVGARAYFNAFDALWSTDGSSAHTQIVASDDSEGRPLVPIGLTPVQGGLVYLTSSLNYNQTGYPRDPALWFIDAAGDPARLIKTITGCKIYNWLPGRIEDGNPYQPIVCGEIFYFPVLTNEDRSQIWESDLTAAGTQRVRVLDERRAFTQFGFMESTGDKVFFLGNDQVHGSELWVIRHAADASGIVGRADGAWYVSAANHDHFDTLKLLAWPNEGGWIDIQARDFNDDGNTDFAARDAANGQWWLWTSNGPDHFDRELISVWTPGIVWTDVNVADLNADGTFDFVGRIESNGQWYATISSPHGYVTQFFGVWSFYATWVDVKVADVNSDGRDDLIGRDQGTGAWWQAISTATGFRNDLRMVWTPGVAWVDIFFDAYGHLIGRLAETGQWFSDTHLFAAWSTAVTWLDVELADIDGDGAPEIVGRTKESGVWYETKYNGGGYNGQTKAIGIWTASLTWLDVVFADFNGDGRQDIAGRDQQTGQWWTSISNGQSLVNQLWGVWSFEVAWKNVGEFHSAPFA